MTENTLLFGTSFGVVSALIYIYVGYRIQQRDVAASTRFALWAFSTWWYALGIITLLGAALSFGAYLGIQNLPLYVAATIFALLGLCVGLWALLYYLQFLYTGSHRIWWLLTLFYALYFFALLYIVIAGEPVGVKVNRWNATLEYAHPVDDAVRFGVAVLTLVPQMFAAVAYAGLYRRVEEPTQRYRIGLVSTSILIWFGSALAASIGDVGQEDWWQLTSRLLGLSAALVILAAYEPPLWVRRRLEARSASRSVSAEVAS